LDLGIDFFAGGTQKWLMGLQGTSYFYISPELHEKIIPKYVGWTSVKDAWNLTEYNLELLESADRYQNGTMSRIGLIAIEASLSLFEEIGYLNTEKQILDNTEYLIGQLIENGFDPILKNLSREKLSGIVTFEHREAENIVENLKRKKIICSLRQGLVRLAPHFYNNKEDLDFLIYNLKESITKK
jgi:selenocysteine lyase/cysteine desulfurase